MKDRLPTTSEALPGRTQPLDCGEHHLVSGRPLQGVLPSGMEEIVLGLGCFWGAERRFWQQPGVYLTAVGYAGGITPNPTYEEVCSGLTGHTEVVRVCFDPATVPLVQVLKLFWESHDPTQGMRQGNDRGTQYRSAIYTLTPEQLALAERSREHYQGQLTAAGLGPITTEIRPLDKFYFAEAYHQQYLARNPQGYCGLRGTPASFDPAAL